MPEHLASMKQPNTNATHWRRGTSAITQFHIAPRTGGCTWLLADTSETYAPYVNLHCVVLAGWDGDTCTIADPLQGRRRVDAAAFLQCFRQMGSRAVVVH